MDAEKSSSEEAFTVNKDDENTGSWTWTQDAVLHSETQRIYLLN